MPRVKLNDAPEETAEFEDDYAYYGNDYGKSTAQIASDVGVDTEDYWRDREDSA